MHRRAVHYFAATNSSIPPFIPADYAAEIKEPAAIAMMQAMQRVELDVPSLGLVQTSYVHHPSTSTSTSPDTPVFVLLHGFDSSLLEFRRFSHLLASSLGDVYTIDLAGWGFSDCGFADNPDIPLGPPQKRAHLLTFIQQVVKRPVVLLGTSLGGTVAIDFTLHHPSWVHRLCLCDAQGFIDGIGPLASMPRFLSVLGVKLLQSVALREMANQMAYFDKKTFATNDALKVGRLHTHMQGWVDANVAFMRSGGYAVSGKVGEVAVPTLVVWGRNDEILSPEYATKFLEALPNAQLAWIEECGHIAALEKPEKLLEAIQSFLRLTSEDGSGATSSTAPTAASFSSS